MKANDIINYATATGMNIEINANEFGEQIIGIEWKNNSVWYWFAELLDGEMLFTERYSMRNGTIKSGFNMTAIKIEKTITASVQ